MQKERLTMARKLGITFETDDWALIIGGSSGIGLETARKLAAHRMNLCILHHDRSAALPRIEKDFQQIRDMGVEVLHFNKNALIPETRELVLQAFREKAGPRGRFRLLLHSIARGNLKPLVKPVGESPGAAAVAELARKLEVSTEEMNSAIAGLFGQGHTVFASMMPAPNLGESTLSEGDLAYTIDAMGSSIVPWAQTLLNEKLFGEDAQVIGLVSEGLDRVFSGTYSAVAAAKSAMLSLVRSMAVEFAPHGVRANVVQPGAMDTPGSRMIPDYARISATGIRRNPFGRLTETRDVANVILLLCAEEANWINGALIHVNGGEHLATWL
jgi:NAD(P)-dependent dehydrogenase (short-subunit alcohol dehydrogenase family)